MFEFQSTLFRNAAEMCDAIASEWLTAGGSNDAAFIAETLAEQSDAALAAEAVSAWGMDAEGEDGQTWMQARQISVSDIEAAFARLRAE
jgi:hypothetical protein